MWAPVEKTPAEKGIIRSLKNLAKKADSVVIGTDFDREGELIGSDALLQVREVHPDVPVSVRATPPSPSAEIDHAFDNLVELDQDLADAGESRQYIDLIWGAVLTRYLTLGPLRRLWQRALRRPRADADARPRGGARARAHGVRAARTTG